MEYFITSAGIPVHINESKKDGPAILLLHGYLETLYIWDNFLDYFPDVFRIISIDLPGHGLTGFPSDGLSNNFCKQFFSEICDKLFIDSCHIISHSCGYYFAKSFLSYSPCRILSITNIDSSLSPCEKEILFINKANNSIKEGSFTKFISLNIPQMYDKSNLRAFDEKIEETIEICETHDPAALSGFFETISNLFSSDCNMIIPVINICGQSNPFINDNSSLFSVISSSGMNSFIEKSEEVYSIISLSLHLSDFTTKNY